MEGKSRQGFSDFLRAERFWMMVRRLGVNIKKRRTAFFIVNLRLRAWIRWLMQVKAGVDTTVKAAERGTGAVQVWHTNRPAG